MRTFLGAALVLILAAVAPVRAGDRDDALAVIDQAIKAHGGEDVLTQAQTAVRTSTGAVASPTGKDLPFKDEMIWKLPDRFRLTLDVGTEKTRLVTVVTPDKGWQTSGGQVAELSPERLDELREEAYVLWLATLVPLKKDSAFELAPLPETKVNGQPAGGVKVAHKGHTDANLYFDKQSGLLVKIERRAREAGLTVDKEYVYGDHKDFDGVKMPTKQQELLNGKRFTELAGISYKFPRSVDDSTFAKP
jgi:hypothetical protein